MWQNPDRKRLENSISFYFGLKIAEIDKLYISPQLVKSRSNDNNQPESTRGHSRTVDFYLNSNLNICLEVVRNSNNLEDHINRFIKPTGQYHNSVINENNFAILDILTSAKGKPYNEDFDNKTLETPVDYHKWKDKLYTYDPWKRKLYYNGKWNDLVSNWFMKIHTDFTNSVHEKKQLTPNSIQKRTYATVILNSRPYQLIKTCVKCLSKMK